MKRLFVPLLSLVVLTSANSGCKKSEPGGEGKETFTMSGPMRSTTVNPKQAETVTLTIRPSRQFKQKIKLEAMAMQEGIKPSFEEQEIALDGSNRDVKLTVTATEKAAPGKYEVRVTAKPEKGEATTLDVAVNVEQKSEDRLTLSGPLTSTNVMQGESNTVTVTLRPSRDFHQDVKLDAKALEDGIQCKLQQDTVKLNGENRDIKLTISADKGAGTGTRKVRVTATPAKGSPKSVDLSFNVKSK